MHLELVRFHKVWWKWLKIGYTGKLKLAKISANNEMQLCLEQTQEKPWCSPTGPVAQWITRLTTDQKIPGSNPGRFDSFWMLWSVFGLLALHWIDLMPKLEEPGWFYRWWCQASRVRIPLGTGKFGFLEAKCVGAGRGMNIACIVRRLDYCASKWKTFWRTRVSIPVPLTC